MQRFLFVGGLHRSGTTALARGLATHDEVSALEHTGAPMDEGQHLQTVVPTARALGGPGVFGFAPGGHLTDASPLATPATRRALLTAWLPYWDASKLVLLEKSPPNLIRTRFLQALFPDAQFVMIVRHPVATALATSKWTHATPEQLLDHWSWCHRLLLDDAQFVDQLHIVRYEDLVAEPDRVLRALARRLGFESDADPSVIVGGHNERYFERWQADGLANDDVVEVAGWFGYRLDEPRRIAVPAANVSSLLPG